MSYTDFFKTATRSDEQPDGLKPFPYQHRFAEELISATSGTSSPLSAISTINLTGALSQGEKSWWTRPQSPSLPIF